METETQNTPDTAPTAVNSALADFARLLSGDLSALDAEKALRQITEKARAATLAALSREKRVVNESMAARGKWADNVRATLRDTLTLAHANYRQIDPVQSISYKIDVSDDGAGNLVVLIVGFPAIKKVANGTSSVKKDGDTRKERRDVGIPREKNAVWVNGIKCGCGEQVMTRDTALAHRDLGHAIGAVSAPESTPDATPATALPVAG